MKPPEETGALAPTVKPVTASELLIDLPPAPPKPEPASPPPPASGDVKRDSLNRPFDPARFLPEPFDTKGRWRNANAGRRKPAAADNTAPIPEVGPETAPGEAPQASGDKTAAPSPEAPPPPRSDATLSPEAGGNLLARVLYSVTGWFIGDRKKAVATGEEHKAIAGTFGAFLSFRGIALVGGLALLATFVIYLLEDSRGESVFEAAKRRFAKKPAKPGDDAKRAEPIDIDGPVSAQPAAPARPAAPSGPAPIHFPE